MEQQCVLQSGRPRHSGCATRELHIYSSLKRLPVAYSAGSARPLSRILWTATIGRDSRYGIRGYSIFAHGTFASIRYYSVPSIGKIDQWNRSLEHTKMGIREIRNQSGMCKESQWHTKFTLKNIKDTKDPLEGIRVLLNICHIY